MNSIELLPDLLGGLAKLFITVTFLKPKVLFFGIPLFILLNPLEFLFLKEIGMLL